MTGQPPAAPAPALDALAWHHSRLPDHVTVHLTTSQQLATLGWIRPATGDQSGATDLLRYVVAHRFGTNPAEVVLHPAVGHPDPRRARGTQATLSARWPGSSDARTRLWTSLSRCGTQIAVVTALTPVGIDLEILQTPLQAAELLTLLHPTDRGTLGRRTGTRLAHEVTAAWTRKEAMLKALGTGLARDPALDAVGTHARPIQEAGWASLSAHLADAQDYYLGLAWQHQR